MVADDDASNFSKEAQATLAADKAIKESRVAYTKFRDVIYGKYSKNEIPTIADISKMNTLLITYENKITAFNLAMQKVKDHSELSAVYSQLNESTDDEDDSDSDDEDY